MPQYFKNVQQVYKQALSLSPLFVSPFFIVSCCHTCRRTGLIIGVVQSETSVEQIVVLAAENTPPGTKLDPKVTVDNKWLHLLANGSTFRHCRKTGPPFFLLTQKLSINPEVFEIKSIKRNIKPTKHMKALFITKFQP